MKRAVAPCARCGAQKELRARGLCSTCHSAARRLGELARYPTSRAWGVAPAPVSPAQNPVPEAEPPQALVRFEGADRALWARLEAAARAERRSVEQQILYYLDSVVPAEGE